MDYDEDEVLDASQSDLFDLEAIGRGQWARDGVAWDSPEMYAEED